MKDVSFQIPKQSDKQVVEAIKRIFVSINKTPNRLLFNLYIQSQLDFDYSEIDTKPELLEVTNYDNELIQSFIFHIGPHRILVISRQDGQFYDNVTVNFGPLNQSEYLFLIASAKKELGAFDPQRTLGRLLSEETKQVYEAREANLKRLEGLSERIIKEAEHYRKKRDEEFTEKSKQLETEIKAKKEQLNQEHLSRLKQLEALESDFKSKLSSFDDRDNRHVRRRIRDEFKQELERRSSVFQLTPGTRDLRLPIFYFTLFLLIIFTTGTVVYFYESIKYFNSDAPLDLSHSLILLIRQLLVTGSFGATAVFFIRWNNQWFQKHADEEFRLKRLDLDIDRASWVVEMALEWKAEKGTEIPEELLDRLTKNLFNEDRPSNDILHPADQIASSILGASTSLKLKAGEVGELSFDRGGIKRLQKDKE